MKKYWLSVGKVQWGKNQATCLSCTLSCSKYSHEKSRHDFRALSEQPVYIVERDVNSRRARDGDAGADSRRPHDGDAGADSRRPHDGDAGAVSTYISSFK